MRFRWLVVLAAAAAAGVVGHRALGSAAVEVTPVVIGTAVESVYASGTVEPDHEIEVKARVGGTVARVLVGEGDWVEAGQLLAVIDNQSLRFDLDRSRGDVRAAIDRAADDSAPLSALRAQRDSVAADLRAARSDVDRGEALIGAGALTVAELEHRKERLRKLGSEWAAADARLRAAELDLPAERDRLLAVSHALRAQDADRLLRAPMAGRVLRKQVEVGELVAAAQPLFALAGDHLRLEARIDESDVGSVAVGQAAAVKLYAFGERVLAGEVVSIAAAADRDRKTFTARIELAGAPGTLRPGMSGEADIVVGRHERATLVPSAALRPDDTVLVADGGRAVARKVRIGLRDLAHVEIVSGVSAGERVVTGGADVSAGARIAARQAPASDAVANRLSMR